MTDVFRELLRIGAVQYGHFEMRGNPTQADPISINLRLLPSYLPVMVELAREIAPLLPITSTTHLLTMPAVIPLGVLASQLSGRTLVYPLDGQIEGAYDFSEPTVLLTDVLTDGAAELAMIRHARREGLDVKAVVAVIDFGKMITGFTVERRAWMQISDVLNASQTAGKLSSTMRKAVEAWLMNSV